MKRYKNISAFIKKEAVLKLDFENSEFEIGYLWVPIILINSIIFMADMVHVIF